MSIRAVLSVWVSCLVALFSGSSLAAAGTAIPPEEKVRKLLTAFSEQSQMKALLPRFGPQALAADEKKRPNLSPDEARALANACGDFLTLLSASDNGPSLDRLALQKFKETYTAKNTDWNEKYLAVERALMAGRAQLVKELWESTIVEFTREHPDKAAYIVGEIDIGSWVEMRLNDFSFAGDIDFSSVAIDIKVNQELTKRFQDKLTQHTGLDMVGADALLTPHGDASLHVFIDEWGKAYAEMELLRPGAVVKILEFDDTGGVLLVDGRPSFKRVPGEQLFWEVALRSEKPVDFPSIDILKEPMLGLEMYRHEIHDIQNGPFGNAQKLIKVMKYLDRSFYVNDKALAAFRSSMPVTDPTLADFAAAVIAAKKKPGAGEAVHRMIEQFALNEMNETLSEANYGSIVARLELRSQIAMHDNACRAISARFQQMSGIENDGERSQALNQFWKDLQKEVAAMRATDITPPAILEQAVKIAQDIENGRLPPEELGKKAAQLRQLLEDSYKLAPTVIDRIMNFDPERLVREYLADKCKWQREWIEKFLGDVREKFPNANALYQQVTGFTEEWNQTLEGSKVLSSLDFANNAVVLFDAYNSARTKADGLYLVAKELVKIKASGHFPMLALGEGLIEAYEKGDASAGAMAIGFYFFPTIGAFYQTEGNLQRLDAFATDENFYRNLSLLKDQAVFKDGRMTSFTLKSVSEACAIPDTPNADQRGDAFVQFIVKGGDLGDLVAGNPSLRYWATLIPRESWEYGMKTDFNSAFGVSNKWDLSGYTKKMDNLRRLFQGSQEINQLATLLADLRSRPLPEDKFVAERRGQVQKLEEAVEFAVWRAVFRLLEAAASPDLPKLEAELADLEHYLSAGDTNLGANKGLLANAHEEVRVRKSWFQSIDFNSKFVLTHYVDSYHRVKAVQQQVRALWETWKVGYGQITAPPLGDFLSGSKNAAPRLTGSPDDDVKLAEACLRGHLARVQLMADHLSTGLNRLVEVEKDRDLLLQTSQLEFELEHVRDSASARNVATMSDEAQAAYKQRSEALQALIQKIGRANLRLFVHTKSVAIVGTPVTANVQIEGFPASTIARFRVVWNGTYGTGQQIGFMPDKPGEVTLQYTAYAPTKSGGEVLIGQSTPRVLRVVEDPKAKKEPETKLAVKILGRKQGYVGEKIVLLGQVELPTGQKAPKLLLKWSEDTRKMSLGRGDRVTVANDRANELVVRLQAVQTDAKGNQTVVAETTHSMGFRFRLPETAAPTNGEAGASSSDASAAALAQVQPAPYKPSDFALSISIPPGWVDPSTLPAPPPDPNAEPDYHLVEQEAFMMVLSGEGSTSNTSALREQATQRVKQRLASQPLPPQPSAVAVDAWVNKRAYELTLPRSEPREFKHERTGFPMTVSYWAGIKIAVEDNGIKGNAAGYLVETRRLMHSEFDFSKREALVRKLEFTGEESRIFDDPNISEDGKSYALAAGMSFDRAIDLTLQEFRAKHDWGDIRSIGTAVDWETHLKHTYEKTVINGWKGYFVTKPPQPERGLYNNIEQGGFFYHTWSPAIYGAVVDPTESVALVFSGGVRSSFNWQWNFREQPTEHEAYLSAACAAVFEQIKSVIFTAQARLKNGGGANGAAGADRETKASQPVVSISLAPGPTVCLGDIVTLRAAVTGGTPPYTYNWVGLPQMVRAAEVAFKVRSNGRFVVGVEALDAKSVRGAATVSLQVNPLQVRLQGIPRGSVQMGEEVRLRMELTPAPTEAPQFAWDASAPYVVDSGQPELVFKADRPGKFTVTGIVKQPSSGDEIARTETATVEVVAPKFEVTFSPANAKPGDEVLAKVLANGEPVPPQFNLKWAAPVSADRMEYDDPASIIGFRVKDDKPLPVAASVRVTATGAEIAKVAAQYAPSAYNVTATVVGPANAGPRPMVWQPGVGLVPADRGSFGTDESVLVRAEIAPVPEGGDVRWNWTANEGTTIQSSDLSREVRVTRNSAGTAALVVTATDPSGIRLGEAEASFTVTASDLAKNPMPPLLRLEAENTKLTVGGSTVLVASVRDGKPPFSFCWSGSVVPSDNRAVFFGRQPGQQAVTVEVTDARGRTDKASLGFSVVPPPLIVQVQTEGMTEPATSGNLELAAGKPFTLRVMIAGGIAPYRIKWNDDAKLNSEVGQFAAPAEPGQKQDFRVEVVDSLGTSAGASVTITTPDGLIPARLRQKRTSP